MRSLIARFGDRLIVDIDHRDVAELQGLRLREGKSARTVNVEVGTLRQILSVHSHWTRIGERVKHLRERQDVGHALSREDEAKLLDAIRQSRSPALLPLFVLAIDTGLRRSELRSLRLKDLKLTWRKGVIDSGELCVPKSKTEAGTGRIVPFTIRACAVLSLWLARFPGGKPDDFVFPLHYVGLSGDMGAAHAYGFDATQPIGEWKKAWEIALKTGRTAASLA